MSDKFADDVARRIRQRAEELGISQADIVRKTGAAKSTVHGWFAGTATPRGASASKLRTILRCSQDWLFEGRGVPSAASETDLYASLDATWESQDNDFKTNMVRVPALNNAGVLDEFDCIAVPTVAINSLKSAKGLGWVKASSRSAEHSIMLGDVVVVDTLQNEVTESGAYYVIAHASGVNIHQVYVEADGSWSVLDASRGSKMSVSPDHHGNIKILGRAVWRSGNLN